MNPIASFFSTLFASRTQAHIYHLQTPSYAAHIALQGYYEGIITGYSAPGQVREYISCEEIIAYFVALGMFVEQNRNKLPQDSYVQNQVDMISELINTTVYKLKFLK